MEQLCVLQDDIKTPTNVVREKITAGGVVSPPYITECFTQFPDNCSDPGWDIVVLNDALTATGKEWLKFQQFKQVNFNEFHN